MIYMSDLKALRSLQCFRIFVSINLLYAGIFLSMEISGVMKMQFCMQYFQLGKLKLKAYFQVTIYSFWVELQSCRKEGSSL